MTKDESALDAFFALFSVSTTKFRGQLRGNLLPHKLPLLATPHDTAVGQAAHEDRTASYLRGSAV